MDIWNKHCYIWTASSEFGTYRLCKQQRFRRACASAQSRQNVRCLLIQAVSQEEPSDRKPDPWPLWMSGHAQLKFVMTECSKTQIRLTGLKWFYPTSSILFCTVAPPLEFLWTPVTSPLVFTPLVIKLPSIRIWATSWQNQQNDLCTQRRQISLGFCPVWSEPSLWTQWVAKDPVFLQADSKYSDQTRRLPRLIWVFTGHTDHFVVLSWGGSFSFHNLLMKGYL